MIFESNGGLSAFYRRKMVAASLRLVAEILSVEMRDLVAARRRSRVAYARQIAMYLCHTAGGLSQRDVAEGFGRNKSTVSHACHAVEDRREDPIHDTQIIHLERLFRAEVRRMIEEAVTAPPDLETKAFPLLRFG